MIDQKRILFTGGSGLLGQELRKLLPDSFFPSHADLDVTDYERMDTFLKQNRIGTVFHAAAFTSPPRVNEKPELAIDSNIVGTSNVVKACMKNNARLIYVSTDYVFRGDKGEYKEDDPVYPVNKYAWSKLGGECAVRMYDNSVVIRTSFGPNEFPYEKAFVDQWTSRESVAAIAGMMLKVIDSDFKGSVNVGGPRKSVFEYAVGLANGKRIGELSTADVSFTVPKDTSLDITLFNSLFNKTKKG